jgi:hypothetical protein
MIFVLPGVDEVCANLLLLHNIFISDDFPTLLRPMKANSGNIGFGQSATLADVFVNMAFFIIKLNSA